MGFVLSLLYFATYYITPPVLFGPFAESRVQLILAVLVFIVSIPKLLGSFIFKTPQSLAVAGLVVAVTLSGIFGGHGLGGAFSDSFVLIPQAIGYFLVCLHFDSRRKIKALVAVLLFVCFFVIAHGTPDMFKGAPESGARLGIGTEQIDSAQWNTDHPYVLAMGDDNGIPLYRLRGLGIINDPNDFGQLIVCVIPLVFLFWKPKSLLWNIPFVVLPVSALLFGLFLTHSRGDLLALMLIAIVAARRRIGTVPALLVAGGLFLAATALHFTGGREISAASGASRTELWGDSLQLLRAHPIFGIGIGGLGDELGLTAHNSILVCAAELGLFGLYFWALFLLPTVRDALTTSKSQSLTSEEPAVVSNDLYPKPEASIEEIDIAEINRLGRLMVLALTGFLAAGLFLSRAFVMTLFILGGMTEVVYQMALQRRMIVPRMRLSRLLPNTGLLAIILIIAMYIAVRLLNFTNY